MFFLVKLQYDKGSGTCTREHVLCRTRLLQQLLPLTMIGSVLLRLCWVVRLVLAVPVDLEELAAGTPTATGSLSKRTLRRMPIYFSLWNNLTAFLASLAAAYWTVALPFDLPVAGSFCN